MEYKLEYCDGYYITKNGKGVIDFAEDVDSDFANFVLGLLEQRLTKRAADGFYCGCKNVVRVKGNPACSECHKPIRPPLTQTVRLFTCKQKGCKHG